MCGFYKERSRMVSARLEVIRIQEPCKCLNNLFGRNDFLGDEYMDQWVLSGGRFWWFIRSHYVLVFGLCCDVQQVLEYRVIQVLFCWAYGDFRTLQGLIWLLWLIKDGTVGRKGTNYGWCVGFRRGRDLYESRAAEKNNMQWPNLKTNFAVI